jgi:redox-sensitive bicupin YhaK (pirin superfamily)
MLDANHNSPHGAFTVPVAAQRNAWIHVNDGTMSIDGGGRLANSQALCASASDSPGMLSCRTDSTAHFVVLGGPRIDEAVIQHGPFVFEDEASLARALADLKAGHFGQVRGFS